MTMASWCFCLLNRENEQLIEQPALIFPSPSNDMENLSRKFLPWRNWEGNCPKSQNNHGNGEQYVAREGWLEAHWSLMVCFWINRKYRDQFEIFLKLCPSKIALLDRWCWILLGENGSGTVFCFNGRAESSRKWWANERSSSSGGQHSKGFLHQMENPQTSPSPPPYWSPSLSFSVSPF